MGTATEDRAKAATLPEGDVIRILLEQHARLQDLFAEIERSSGASKQQAFDQLRVLLAVHETGEEMVVRPVSRQAAGEQVAEARNAEENQATHVLADLEKMDANSPEFDATFARFKKAVLEHVEHEETEEFPRILAERDTQMRQRMGKTLTMAEKAAPTHPHPSAAGSTVKHWTMGPFASMLDRARDAVKNASH